MNQTVKRIVDLLFEDTVENEGIQNSEFRIRNSE